MNSPPLSELKQSVTMKLDALTPKLHHMMESANTKFEAIKVQVGQLMQSTTKKMESTNTDIRFKLPVIEQGIFNMSLRTTAFIIGTISLILIVFFLQVYIDFYSDVKRTLLRDDLGSFGREADIDRLQEGMTWIIILGCLIFINILFFIGVLKKKTIFILPWFYCAGTAVVLFCFATVFQVIFSLVFFQFVAAIIFVYSILVVKSYIKEIKGPSRTNNIYSEQLLSPDSTLVTNEDKNKLNNEYSPQSNNDVPLIDNMIKPTDSCIA